MFNSLNKNRFAQFQSPDYYKMNHEKRGLALIFNHDKVSSLPLLDSRLGAGSNADVRNLENSLKNLQFEVEVNNNLELSEIIAKLEEVRNQDHTDHDCLVIAILTYGEKGRLYSDDQNYDLEKIMEHFIASKCPSLAAKPKILIIQACELSSIKRNKRDITETDSVNRLIPNHADFLIEYSTIPGNFAWSDEGNHGSWFINSFCAELDAKAKKLDFLTLLTIVKQRVDREFQMFLKNPSKQPTGNVGVPITTYMLTRKLKFNVKPVIDEYPGIDGVRTASEAMLQMNEEDKLKIIQQVGLFLQEKVAYDTEFAEWNEKCNEIILLANQMCMVMMEMTEFTQGRGPLKTTSDVVKASKKISEAGTKFEKLAKEIANQCKENSIKKNLQTYSKKVVECCRQIQKASTINVNVQIISGRLIISAALDGATSLIQAAKNLMNAVTFTVKYSYEASSLNPKQKTSSTVRWYQKGENMDV